MTRVGLLAGVVHGDDGGVVQAGGRLGLAAEAGLEGGVGGQVGPQLLDRHRASEPACRRPGGPPPCRRGRAGHPARSGRRPSSGSPVIVVLSRPRAILGHRRLDADLRPSAGQSSRHVCRTRGRAASGHPAPPPSRPSAIGAASRPPPMSLRGMSASSTITATATFGVVHRRERGEPGERLALRVGLRRAGLAADLDAGDLRRCRRCPADHHDHHLLQLLRRSPGVIALRRALSACVVCSGLQVRAPAPC